MKTGETAPSEMNHPPAAHGLETPTCWPILLGRSNIYNLQKSPGWATGGCLPSQSRSFFTCEQLRVTGKGPDAGDAAIFYFLFVHLVMFAASILSTGLGAT